MTANLKSMSLGCTCSFPTVLMNETSHPEIFPGKSTYLYGNCKNYLSKLLPAVLIEFLNLKLEHPVKIIKLGWLHEIQFNTYFTS